MVVGGGMAEEEVVIRKGLGIRGSDINGGRLTPMFIPDVYRDRRD